MTYMTMYMYSFVIIHAYHCTCAMSCTYTQCMLYCVYVRCTCTCTLYYVVTCCFSTEYYVHCTPLKFNNIFMSTPPVLREIRKTVYLIHNCCGNHIVVILVNHSF